MGSAVKSKEAVEVTWIAFQDLESWRTGLKTLNTLATVKLLLDSSMSDEWADSGLCPLLAFPAVESRLV